MESPDVFTQQQEIGNDDPFAGSDFGDWEQDPAAQQEPTPVEPLPPEDPTQAEPDGTTGSTTEERPDAEAFIGEHMPDTPDSEPAEALAPPPPPPSPSQAARENGPAPGVIPPASSAPQSPVPPPAPVAPPEPAAAGAPPSSPNGPVASPQGAQEAATPSDGVLAPSEAQVAAEQARREAEGDAPVETPPRVQEAPRPASDAPLPEEAKDKRGRVTHRRYVILRADGPGRFVQLDWHEDKNHKLAMDGGSGTKRQTVVLARGTEEALKFGYVVVGSPPKGAELVAVAAAYFQIKTVAPEPPEPLKQRLRIN